MGKYIGLQLSKNIDKIYQNNIQWENTYFNCNNSVNNLYNLCNLYKIVSSNSKKCVIFSSSRLSFLMLGSKLILIA